MATDNTFTKEDVTEYLATTDDTHVDQEFTPEDFASYNNQTQDPSEALAKSTDVHNDNAAETLSAHTDYLREASQAVKPIYQNAINKVNTFFDTNTVQTPDNQKLRLQDKASILGMNVNELADVDPKSLDNLLFRKRAKEAAGMYPEYVNKADQKSLEQLFVNPKAVKQINNSAKARVMKATTLEKFVNTNKASILSMGNTLEFLGPDGDFEEWAIKYQLIDSERKANNATTKGTPKLNQMWNDWAPFSDSKVSFTDIAKYITMDPEGFKAAFAEASNSAASISTSIAGRAAGAGAGLAVGTLGGPITAVGGGLIGAYTAGAIAAMDEYLQNEIDTNYRDNNGDINWKAVRTDADKLKNKWRIEAAEQGIIGGALEMFAPKILRGAGGKASKVVPKVFKTATVKALSKAGKFGKAATSVATKGAQEFIGEGLSDAIPKTLIDFQNGRLDKNKLRNNAKDGVREGVAGAITAGTLAAGKVAVSQAANIVSEDSLASKSTPEAKPSSKPDVDAEFTNTTESKPHNERTPEEVAASEYKTAQAEDTLELSSQLDDDADVLDSVEGMTDHEKVALIDSANIESVTTEEGVVIQGTPTEAIVNGADIETLLGDDVAILQSVLVEERQSELAQAISAGEDFKFTYGEWVVAANKLKDKHPTINHLVVNTETEMAGYEAVSHLSEVLDLLQSQYDSLAVPAVESTPPAIPGISAEIAADSNPAAISSRRQTGIVKEVLPTGNMNQVTLVLIDGSTHLIDLYDQETAQDIQVIADKLAKQFDKALSASGRTTDIVRQASLQGIPVIMRVLVKRAKALNKPISDMAKSIRFASDASSGSAYIGTNSVDPSKVVYGVGRTAQRVSTVAHEFAHAILHFMTVDGPELEAQKQAGTLTPEGAEYFSAIEATAKLLGLKSISDVNDMAATTLTDPKTGKIISRNQSRQILTKRTVTHEKLATTMEVFLKAGHLKTDAMDTDISKILLYWRSLIPSEVLSRQASVAATEGWTYSGEYHQALDPSDEVGDVFNAMYSVNQQIDKTTVPMFNFSYFPVEILGKGGQLILDKVIASKHTAIAKVFAKVYADSINARTLINTPEAIANMNKDLAEAYGATFSGELVNSLSQLGLKIPESLSKDLSNIQELMQRYNADKVPFIRDATESDIEALLSENTDAFDAGDSVQTVIGRMADTFSTTKIDIYQKNLEDLGYVTDDKVKQASEEMLAKALPSILNDQFTQLVQAYPAEAKQLFSAYIKNGKVSSRIANKHVTIAAQENLDKMSVKDLRIKALIKNVRDTSTEVVNYFNQGKYIDALIAKFDELTKSEMLRLAPDLIKQVESSTRALHTYGSLDYVYANAGKVHPETMQYLRDVLNAIAAKTPVDTDAVIENLDAELNAFVEGITVRMLSNVAGKKLDSVGAIIELGEYAKIMARVAAAASRLEKEGREFVTSTKVDKAKFTILKSTKVWDMRSKLPQANSVHEVFSTYFSSEEAYRDSAIAGVIYDIVKGESQATNEAGEISKKLAVFAKKSLSKKLEPMTLPLSGLKVEDRSELLSVLLYLGSDSGRDTFMRTHKLVNVDPITMTATLKDAELKKDLDDLVAQGLITADDIALVNAISAEFVPMLKMIQEVYRRDKGIQVGEIAAVPFKVGGFDLTGGYFPISYNEVMEVGNDAKAESMFYHVFGMRNFSRTKERGEGKRTPVKLGITPVTSYINMVMREYYIKPPMHQFKAFVNDPEVNSHIQMTRPGALAPAIKVSPTNVIETGIINDWVSTVDNQVRSDIDPNTPKLVNWILRNTSFVFYSMDAIAATTNTVAGLPAAVPYVTSNLRLALNVMTWPLTIRRGNKRSHLSEQLKANERQFVQFVLSENTEELYSKLTTTKEFMNTAAMMFQKVSQHVLERIIWNTEYESQMAKGNTTEGSVKHADLVTERSLGRYALSNKSLGQKAGVFGRLTNIASQHLITFKRQFNVEMKRDGYAWRKAYMSSLVIASALASIKVAMELHDWATPDRPREDEEKKNMRMKVQMGAEMLPYFFGAYGRVLSATINLSGGGSDVSITPVEHTIKQVIRGFPKLPVSWGTDYKMGARDYADVFGMVTMFTGVPFSGISNVNDFITAFRDHDEIMYERLMEDAERAAYYRQFGEEYNPLID
jgi:hypothetical protein